MATVPDNRLTLRSMGQDDIAAVHSLSRTEQWPHREEDLSTMLAVGDGIVMEMGGEIVGEHDVVAGGSGVTTLGMVIVSRRHRGAGIGRIVMEAALDRIGDGTVMLNATEEGLPLYRKLGFVGMSEILQHQGTSFSAPLVPLDPDERIRPRGGADVEVVNQLIEHATGLVRPEIVRVLLDKAHGIVLDRAGTVTGCALFRRFGRGYVIGPVIAPDVVRAKALIAQWLGSRSGEFIRLDIPADCKLGYWLEELGLVQVGKVITMFRGAPPSIAAPGQSFAIVSQALLLMAVDGLANTQLFVERILIDGAWTEAASRETLNVVDPATGMIVGTIPAGAAGDAERAIAAAAAALPAWRRRTADDRATILERWHELILANADDLAKIMTSEQGKPLAEAKGEVLYAASFVKWFAGEGWRVSGHTIPAPTADRRVLATREPVGVCAAITPWNFPAAMITRKVAPAFAAGCTVIVKPSELTPYTALALGVLAQEAGLPAGVLNIITGLPDGIGGALTQSPIVRKLSFTGSTRVGSLLMRQSADTLKRLSLELGGNAPFIVFDDADVDLAVTGAMASKFRNAGQTCVCANRLLVQSGIHDRFVDRLGEAVRALRVGDGRDSGVTIGPLINSAATAKVADHVADALSHGARIAATASGTGDERFAIPVVLTGASAEMRLASEETFGPVAPIFRFESEEEALALANATPFGLASYFYTDDLHRAWRVGEALEFGMVGLNTGSIAMEMAPFGGIKASGLGREGGREGIDEYLETKAFHWGGLKGQ